MEDFPPKSQASIKNYWRISTYSSIKMMKYPVQEELGWLFKLQLNIVISFMERHIERGLQRDIKHIVSMQSLLEEYDRENKYLNKQVLDLINENTKLRMDKLKANIVNDLLQTDKKSLKTPTRTNIISQFIPQSGQKRDASKIKPTEEKQKHEEKYRELQRNSSKKIVNKFKLEDEKKPQQIAISKKDEAVQTPTIEKTTVEIQQDQEQSNTPTKPKEQIVFSFRHPSEKLQFQSPSVSSKQFISQCDIKFCQSNELQRNINNTNNDSSLLAISREKSQASIPRNPSKTIVSLNESTIKKESSATEQHFRRSHAIKPSPQVDTSLSKQRNFMTPSASEKKLGSRHGSHVQLRPFQSVEKKRKFLQVVSVSLTPSKVARDKGDCC